MKECIDAVAYSVKTNWLIQHDVVKTFDSCTGQVLQIQSSPDLNHTTGVIIILLLVIGLMWLALRLEKLEKSKSAGLENGQEKPIL